MPRPSPALLPAAVPKAVRTVALLVLVAAVVTAASPGVIRVRPGDTLSELALRHRTSVATLQALNAMEGRTLIYAGQSLRVPGRSPAKARPAVRTTTRTTTAVYRVRPGDGLIVVARRLGTTVNTLIRLNRLDRTVLYVGETLRYPVRGRTVAAAPRRTASTPVVRGSVAASARAHRAMLAARDLPSKAAVKELVRRAARRHGVPTWLALSVAYHESGFQQRVVSPVDAIGAMQVLPSTGRSLGRLHGRTFDLLRASDNVEAGVLLLKDLLRATGSVDRALAGYYQGLGSISRKGLLPQTKQYIRSIHALRSRFS